MNKEWSLKGEILMTSIESNNQNMQLLIEDLTELKRLKNTEGFQRGELKQHLDRLAAKYNFSFHTVKRVYYTEIKDDLTPKKPALIQEIRPVQPKKVIQQFHQSQATTQEKNRPHLAGDNVKVKVKNVIDYGVFIQTIDEPVMEGLLHISEIKYGYVEDIFTYFDVDDIFVAEIKKVVNDEKLELTTKNMPFPIKKIDENEVNESVESVEKVDEQKDLPEPPSSSTQQNDESLKDVMVFLNGIVGALSPKSKEKLKELVEEYGVFKFTLAMVEASNSFENDLGLRFLGDIEKKIADGL